MPALHSYTASVRPRLTIAPPRRTTPHTSHPTPNSTTMDLNNNNLDDQTELKARGNWNQLKGEAKQKWGQLTDDDLDYADGKQRSEERRVGKEC